MPNLERAATHRVLRPELARRDLLRERERNRRAAVLCLQAAAKTDDVSERTSLRRQAAVLILAGAP
jgi:hypothetical protein